MPKKTFFNLDQKKQEMIVSSAIKVFSAASYDEVKIATLIREAQIPRTSFYDYFEDKMDLYGYIMLLVAEKKKAYSSGINLQGDFFENLRAYFNAGLNFMIQEPELDALSKRLLNEPKLMIEIFGEKSMDVSNIFEAMLNQGIEDGVIRENINVPFISKTLNILSREMMLDAVKDDEHSMEEIIGQISDELITFLQYGLKK